MLTWKTCFLKSKHWFWCIPSMDSQFRMLSITINFLLKNKVNKETLIQYIFSTKKSTNICFALKYFTESTNH